MENTIGFEALFGALLCVVGNQAMGRRGHGHGYAVSRQTQVLVGEIGPLSHLKEDVGLGVGDPWTV